MAQNPIVKIYLSVVGPLRFIVHRRAWATLDTYERYSPGTIRDYLIDLFSILAVHRPDFMRVLAEHDDQEFMNSRQQRRFIAEDRSHLYIGSPHLTEKYSAPCSGFWIATNISGKQAGSIARMACSAASVQFASISKLEL